MTGTFTRGALTLAVAALAVSGCAVTPENAYPDATSATECQAAHQVDVQNARQSQSYTRSSGNAFADIFAKALAGGVSESVLNNRLSACLTRVGGGVLLQDPPASGGLAPLPSTNQLPAPTQGGSCVSGRGVMVHGDRYCVGNL